MSNSVVVQLIQGNVGFHIASIKHEKFKIDGRQTEDSDLCLQSPILQNIHERPSIIINSYI